MRSIAALALAVVCSAQHISGASAAEVKVVSALAMSPALKALASEFERTSGHKLALSFGTAGQVKDRVETGESVDVVITAGRAVDDLIKQGKVATGSRVDVAKVGIGLAVRSGAPKPDISTAEAFKRTLLAAKSIARGDPTAGGAAGTHVARVLERLGIDSEVKAKSRLSMGPAIAELAAKGEAEIAITKISEIVPVPGVDLVPWQSARRRVRRTSILPARPAFELRDRHRSGWLDAGVLPVAHKWSMSSGASACSTANEPLLERAKGRLLSDV